jgi:hypothetical protein
VIDAVGEVLDPLAQLSSGSARMALPRWLAAVEEGAGIELAVGRGHRILLRLHRFGNGDEKSRAAADGNCCEWRRER